MNKKLLFLSLISLSGAIIFSNVPIINAQCGAPPLLPCADPFDPNNQNNNQNCGSPPLLPCPDPNDSNNPNDQNNGTTQEGTPSSTIIPLVNPLCDDSDNRNCLFSVLDTIIQRLGELATLIVVIMIIYGGFQMLFAGGNPQKFADGRRTITYAAIGLLVILMARGVTGILQSLFSS
ncbi:MAG: hypothetical protein KGZ30_02300 [Anaplasmataceae bacterium]|nr:hypothetical protein [Anaplasmataceae bacterium]